MPSAPEPCRRALRLLAVLAMAAGSASCADTARARYYRAQGAAYAPTPMSAELAGPEPVRQGRGVATVDRELE